MAEYNITDESNEVFTIDDLGNRELVNVRDGSNVYYEVDANTNRYDSIGGSSLTYNNAGDLTIDKDAYKYQYDYENRITKVLKPGPITVAEFAYVEDPLYRNALGRRICKVDWLAETGVIYYNNDNWQVLCEYDAFYGDFERWYAYGNYIDEVLVTSQNFSASHSSTCLYVHDHIYSPVALVRRFLLSLQERYEYDAYGNPHVLDPYTYAERPLSNSLSRYLFTGRELDIFDSGSLKIQYNRNRYYDSYTGRWTTHDPLAIVPNPQFSDDSLALEECQSGSKAYESPEVALLRALEPSGVTQSLQNLGSFDPPKQYYTSLSLYEYVNSRPVIGLDPCGKSGLDCLICSYKLMKVSKKCKKGCGKICDEYHDNYCAYAECMSTKWRPCVNKCINGIAKSLKSCAKCASTIPK